MTIEELLPQDIKSKLIANYNENLDNGGETSHYPVVKYFGGSACTWLVTELDEESGLFFGIADLGLGNPQIGCFSMNEIFSLKFKPFNLGIERDLWFEADRDLKKYGEEAREKCALIA